MQIHLIQVPHYLEMVSELTNVYFPISQYIIVLITNMQTINLS